jgi:hypothetical protein
MHRWTPTSLVFSDILGLALIPKLIRDFRFDMTPRREQAPRDAKQLNRQCFSRFAFPCAAYSRFTIASACDGYVRRSCDQS